MPRNTGRMPPFGLVDLMFRNGKVKREQDPTKWRWKPWDFEADYDIVRWQRNINDRTEDERGA